MLSFHGTLCKLGMSNNQKKIMNLQSCFISRVRVRPPAWRHFVHCHRRERFVPFIPPCNSFTNSACPRPQTQTFTNGWRTTSTPTPCSNTSPPKLYRTTRFSKQRVQRQRKDKKWREIKATSGWLVSRGKRIPRRIRISREFEGFFFQVEGFWFSSVSLHISIVFYEQRNQGTSPASHHQNRHHSKGLLLFLYRCLSGFHYSLSHPVHSYSYIITHPVTLSAKLREKKQCHTPDHLMYIHPFPPFSPSYTRPHLHQ